MLKKIYFSAFLALVVTTAHAETLSELESQLNNIRTEMNSIKRSWNSARIRIKMAEKASSTLYQTVKPIFERLIASSEFSTKMNDIVYGQYEAIANRNMSFASVKTTFNLSDFLPNLSMHTFGQNLFSAMANKECCLLLGQKLASRAQDLQYAIVNAQQALLQTSQY